MSTSTFTLKDLYEDSKFENKFNDNYNDKKKTFFKEREDDTLKKILNDIYSKTQESIKTPKVTKPKKGFNK